MTYKKVAAFKDDYGFCLYLSQKVNTQVKGQVLGYKVLQYKQKYHCKFLTQVEVINTCTKTKKYFKHH